MTDRNVWRRRDESEFSLFICVEAALTRSLVEIPEWNQQIALDCEHSLEKRDERLMREDNGVFHRRCRSQRAREYSSCGIFIELPMQGCAYIWAVWEGRMSTTYLAVSGIREVFPKTGGSHFNKYRIMWAKCRTRQSDILTLQVLLPNPTAFHLFRAQLFELHTFHISHRVVC